MVLKNNLALSIVGSSRNNGDREKNDFYPTPKYAVEELLKREKFEGNIWECACGEGDISEVLINHDYDVISSDLIDRGYGTQQDFFNSNIFSDNIITNPPYKYALEFVVEAKKQSKKKIAMFLKTVFLESEKRKESPTVLLSSIRQLRCTYSRHTSRGALVSILNPANWVMLSPPKSRYTTI